MDDDVGLSAERVREIFADSLTRVSDAATQPVTAEGVSRIAEFHPGRLESHRQEIAALLAELPGEFHEGRGNGASFANARVDRHGNEWSTDQGTTEKLLLLGLATEQVAYTLQRELWADLLQDGQPHFVVKKPPAPAPTRRKRSTSVEFNGHEVENPLLRVLIIVTTVAMFVYLSPLLIVGHVILRLFGRRGFFITSQNTFHVSLSDKAFRKTK
ncbi:MAG TPA: hypothetical protein VLF91_04060 [Candidatus Saccharimonadales bacterium]|nr:hypothetical protein [Candidatus Saccharimonadales bacterium]